MIREDRKLTDVQDIIRAFLKVQASPWTEYDIVNSFPNRELGAEFTKLIVYIQPPIYVDPVVQAQGAANHRGRYMMDIGFWNDEKTGGKRENWIAVSEFNNLFQVRPTLYTTTFTVVLGTTTHTSKTLKYHGITVERVANYNDLSDPEAMDCRSEVSLSLVF